MRLSSKSSDSGKLSVGRIKLILEQLKSKQTRDSTAKMYHSVWRQFNEFLLRLDRSQVKTSWEDRAVLLTHLVSQGAQSQTIESYFSAIKYTLRADGYDWNDQKAMLGVITKSCRIINNVVRIRLPIKIRLLELLLYEVGRIFNSEPYLDLMYKTIFIISYYGLMRVGEVASGTHPLKAKDVHIADNKNKILLILHSSKTHGKESPP